jgi:hypothetical protein
MKGDNVTDEDKLAEHAGDREDKFMQLIIKVRDEAKKIDDQETVEKLESIYKEIENRIENIDKERREKVRQSQIWALEQEIEVYGEAIEKAKVLMER